jgi:hypothetical protein
MPVALIIRQARKSACVDEAAEEPPEATALPEEELPQAARIKAAAAAPTVTAAARRVRVRRLVATVEGILLSRAITGGLTSVKGSCDKNLLCA